MELITKKWILENLPNHYRQSHPKNIRLANGKYTDEVLKQLQSEDPLTEARANEIIGNESWTSNKCNECNKDLLAVVELGEDPDIESRTARICLDCLNKAVDLFKTTNGNELI
jgi:hypothetical protein